MAKKSHRLPESLELLLDTMCNTFGGIMFIAIALTIVTQLSNQEQKLRDAQLIRPEDKLNMLKQQRELQRELEKIRQIQQQSQLQQSQTSAEKMRSIEQLLTLRQKNRDVLSSIAEQKAKQQQNQNALAEAENALRRDRAELSRLLAENEKQKIALQKRDDMALEQLRRLQKQIENIEKEMQALQQKFQQGPPLESISFSMEKETSAREYMILLAKGRLYREKHEQEVRLASQIGKFITYKPQGQGWEVSEDEGNTAWQQVLDKIDREYYYIRLVVDDDSFDTLLNVKRYLRQKKYLVSWSYNPEFTFKLVSNVRFRASQ